MMSSSSYRQDIIEDARHPAHFGKLKNVDIVISGSNPACGDELTLYLKLQNPKSKIQIIERATFDGRGCMVMMASASRFLEHIQGKSLKAVRAISDQRALRIFGVPLTPSRETCALMPLIAIKKTA